jgi:glycogen debranching enzyme
LPWYTLPFGRDGLIAGFQTLEINPSIMKGVLLFQAKHQASIVDLRRQAAPGKIMHEMRLGETSQIDLNPFGRYYGGVDTTLLFVIAVHAYWRRTGCDAMVQELWQNVDLALRWLSDYGDLDGDGFVEYEADPEGLTNQGWKDSWDAIMHANGELAKGPIALCEVQGYAYAAWRAGGAIAAYLGLRERAAFCDAAAEKLYRAFNDIFWLEDLGIYALALDGAKRPCRVRSSNMAHLPWCRIVPKDRGRLVMKQLIAEPLFSGWGIRTLAQNEKLYKADVYHRGPCWPFELAIASWSAIALEDRDVVRIIASASLDAAEAFGFRLPELFCGFQRIGNVPPVHYKSANPMHATAAGVAFAQIQSVLSLDVVAHTHEVFVDASCVPSDWLPLSIHGLQLSESSISFRIEQNGLDAFNLQVLHRQGRPIALRDRRTGNDQESPTSTP